MRTTFIVLALAAITLAAAGSALAGVTVGGQDAGYTLQGTQLGTGRATGDTGGKATAETQDTILRAKAPMCKIGSDGEKPTSECRGPEFEAQGPAPTLDVDVVIGFGKMEDVEAPASEAPTLATAGGYTFAAEPATVLLATAAAGASLAAIYGAWRAVKLLAIGGASAIPLYSHISDDHLLDDENRAKIFALIREVPGISTKDVAERLDLAWGTVTHHLAKLEKRRMIVSKKYGKYRRYFLNGALPRMESKDALAVLRVPATAEVADFIKAHPGFTQKSVSQALGVSSSTILWHVKRLEQVGLVQKLRDGKTVKYFPGLVAAPALTPYAVPVGASPGAGEPGSSFFVA